jgi:hypothetical protein
MATTLQLVAGVDTLVLERLSKIMGYLRMGSSGKGKKLKKREKAALLMEADAARAGLSNGVSAGVTPLKGVTLLFPEYSLNIE